LLLNTRELIRFVACRTADVSEIPGATPVAILESDATPEAVADSDATPVSSLSQLLEEEATPEASPAQGVEGEIDALLDQMTACWATGEPVRFLPLLSQEYQQALVSQSDTEENFLRGLADAMGTPIVFTRAGDLQVVDETHVTAIVRTATGPEESFVRFGFVFEDGSWKWDGPA
jgi:hypothetical protein